MTTLRLPNLELNTNAYTKVNIFHNLYTTTLFRRINTNIINNISFYDSTLIKEGYTTLGLALDPNPYFNIAILIGLIGQAEKNKYIYLLQQI